MALARASHAAPCSFESEAADISWVTVSPTGSTPFRLRLDKRPLTATPGAGGISTIEVASPLRFTATQSTNRLGARFMRRTAIADGRIVVAKGLEPNFVSQEGDDFEGVTGADSIAARLPLPGLTTETPLLLPCPSITISHNTEDFFPPILKQETEVVRFVKTDAVIKLYKKREARSPLALRLTGSWLVVAEQENWVRLQARWSDGSMVRGWVPSSAVKIKKGVPLDESTEVGMGGLGLCGGGHRGIVTGVRIHSHAPIHDGPGGAIWAHTAGSILVDVFSVFRADGWIQVATIEGLPKEECREHNRIWVHAKHILWAPVAKAK